MKQQIFKQKTSQIELTCKKITTNKGTIYEVFYKDLIESSASEVQKFSELSEALNATILILSNEIDNLEHRMEMLEVSFGLTNGVSK